MSRLNGKLYEQVEETFASDSGRICGRIRPRFGEKLCQDLMGNFMDKLKRHLHWIPTVFAAQFGQDFGRKCVKTLSETCVFT